MTHVDGRLHKLVADWMAAHPFNDLIPQNLNPPPRTVVAGPVDLRFAIDAKLNETDGAQRTTYKQRRKLEEKIAAFIDSNASYFSEHAPELITNAMKLRACRRSGTWGERHEGCKHKVVIGWDFKCGIPRLCPDESRAEQRRLVRRYRKPALAWVAAKPAMRRIQKGVVTWPNVALGSLAPIKRAFFKELSKLTKKFPTIKGVLASQEDPLSEHGDWNVHVNVVFLVEGRLDWMALIEQWTAQTRHLFPTCDAEHFQIKMRELPRFDDDALDDALREVVKYAIKHQDMSAIAPERFAEWWKAGKAFRRTRSYGVLFRIGDPKREFAEVVWHGRVWWDDRASAYAVSAAVSSTQANNSMAKTQGVGGRGPPFHNIHGPPGATNGRVG